MKPLVTVPRVDLARYVGLWFEVRRLPNRFEDDDASDVTARYERQPDGTVRVENACVDARGKPVRVVGSAQVKDDTGAKLAVSFLPRWLRWLPGTRGDYWILALDDAYRVALVGTPNRKFLWLLAREPTPDAAVVKDYLGRARAQGFDTTRVIAPRQSGRDPFSRT